MYAFVLMIFATLLPYFGDGPLWQFSSLTNTNCKKYWWTNILYVNNLVDVDKMVSVTYVVNNRWLFSL